MSRPKTEINSKRAERLQIIFTREKVVHDKYTQTQFAEEIGLTQQSVSRIFHLNQPLVEETARHIVEVFPDYRIQWLLGDDDYMTHYDYANKIQKIKDLSADSMWCLIEKSLNKEGKSLKFVHRTGQHVDSSERLRADCYYSIVDRDGKELKRLTAFEMVEFEERIQEYCDFMVERHL